MDKEYIDRQSIYDRVKTHTNPYGKPTLDYESGLKVLNMIKTEFAADVAEVRHAKVECALSIDNLDYLESVSMKKTVVINLFGSPGAGKSTGAAWLFAQLKMRNINAELVTEFAKDKTWENNAVALSCQEYVFGKQSYKLARCRELVDVIVTDSPLPLGIIYNSTPHLGEEFNRTIINVFNTYDNMNYFIERDKPYNPIGRNQTEIESDRLTDDIKHMLDKYGIQYDTILGTEGAYKTILVDVLNYLSWNE